MSHPLDFSTIGLLGFGTGSDVARTFAASGRRVLELDTPDPRLLADVDVVIEAGKQDLESTKRLVAEVVAHVAADVPILAAGPVLSVTDLAAAVPTPTRVAGLHFFGTGPDTRTVEVVRALQSDEALIDRLVALVDSLEDKVPVVVKDRPGFLVNALFLPYLNDVIQELDDGLATAKDIDVALKLGLGYRVGPFELLDRTGVGRHLATTQAVYAATGDAQFAPPPLLRQMVAAGHLGDETGTGFDIPQPAPDN